MRTFKIITITLFLFFLTVSVKIYGQTCISQNQTRTPWTYIPYFDGDNDYISINEENASSSHNASTWFDGDFSMDLWMRPTFPSDATDKYVFFSVGEWCDDYNSLYIYFEKYGSGSNHWRIRISDGTDNNSETDLFFYIYDYQSDWYKKWHHLTFTYDDSKMRLYINGILYKTGDFIMNHVSSSNCMIGDRHDHSNDFRGDISGFRIWTQRKLSDNEVSYIWDKTFDSEKTFKDSRAYLYSHLKLNMYTASDNIYSLIEGRSMVEYNIDRETSLVHPARPIKPYTFTVTENFDNIHIDWESNCSYHTHYIYRRQAGQSSWGSPICITNSTYYTDDDPALQCGVEYEYKIATYWYNSANPLGWGNGYYDTEDPYELTASLKEYPEPQNLIVDVDASSGNCAGIVKIKWNEITNPTPSSYYVRYSYDGGSWHTLDNNCTVTQYTHTVPSNLLGKDITYWVEANGDGCQNVSSVIGTGNTECTTKPTNLHIEPINGNIKLSWDFAQNGAPATAFKIYKSTDGGTFETFESSISINDREYIDNEASMCIPYQYKIEAYNQCGENNSLSDASNDTVIPVQFNNVFTYDSDPYFDASKGYYNNKIALEWVANPNKLGDIDSYEIYRKLNDDSYTLLTTIYNSNATTYNDITAEANVFYEYKIRAIGECNGTTVISDSLIALGFRMNTGIVSGKITYAGGTAVKDVEVRISASEEVGSTSLKFDGNDDILTSDKFTDDSLFHNSLTVEAWIKPGLMISGQRNVFFSIQNSLFYIGIKNMKPIVGLNTYSFGNTEDPIARLEGDSLLEDTWYHIAVTLNPDSGTINLYLNGELVDSDTYENPQNPWAIEDPNAANFSNYNVLLGYGGTSTSMFTGNIDELRIWKKIRTPEEIKRDYTRLQTGKEDSLIGYYHFNEGFSNSAYDISKGSDFNKNDFSVAEADKTPEWSLETPSFEQLHPSGISDENGNYIVEGIQYSGNGSIFSVSPFLGVHEFNPTDVNLFIGDGQPVHNNVDFVDQSSFRFTGTVYYYGTNFPVKGANVYVDNSQQFDQGGNPIQTNQHGQIDINVPIGEHYVSVKKHNHIFTFNGQWPHPTSTLPYNTHPFLDDVNNITFYDSTTVIVAGRFVGDDVEGNKILGFGKSKANIGQGTIVFKNELGYDIDTDVNNESSQITIQTNSETGEYEIHLLPEVYKIDSVWNDHYQMNPLDLGLLDLTTIPQLTTLHDTVVTQEIEDGDTITTVNVSDYEYHFKRNFIYYELPELYVFSTDTFDFKGEDEIIIQDPETEQNDTVNLANNSPFLYPIFEMGKIYDINIYVRAKYFNYDNINDTIVDIVPVQDANVSIANNLEISEPINSYSTNANGLVSDYKWFRVGLPNMSTDGSDYQKSYTKTMTITATTPVGSIQWNGNEGNLFRAYVLGGVDVGGQNFVTYGPQIPEFVLHDPPGTNSYTYLEKESGFTVTNSYNFKSTSGSDYDNKIMYGAKFEIGGGLAGPVFSAETENTLNFGMEKTQFVDKSGHYSESYKFTKRFSTSDQPNAVGSMADVYIGKSYNMFFTQTHNLRILPLSYCENAGLEHLNNTALNDTVYTLGQRDGFAVTDDSSATMFMYSQDHIMNTLLPSYRELIFNLLANNPLYTSKIPASHPLYGTANDAPIWADTIAITGDSLPSYVFSGDSTQIDTIAFLNQQISIWIQTIALNEKAKVTADNLQENISFDGSAGQYSSETSYTSSSLERTDYSFKFKLYGGSQMGFDVNKFGVEMISKSYKEWERELGFEIEHERSMKFGYVIDDDDMSDYYSVDVMLDDRGVLESDINEYINDDDLQSFTDFHNAMGYAGMVNSAIIFAAGKLLGNGVTQGLSMYNTALISAAYLSEMGNYRDNITYSSVNYGLCGSSPIFRILGGQSSCPYEGPEYTAFYVNPSNNHPVLLHQGTQRREEPVIQIDPQSVINVPEGSQAVFDLKLTNASPTGSDFIYELSVDQASNPDGAVLRVDGLDPNKQFFIPAGQTLTKTLTVEQGASGELNYDSLQLIFHSVCQYDPTDNFPDIADTVRFSARFVPTCTEVNFGNITQNWVNNVYTKDTMPIVITNYNMNQSTFQKIYFQYQQAGSTPTTFMTVFNDTTGYANFTGRKMLVDGHASVAFDFYTSALNDGEYTLFLTTVCSDGSIYESEHLNGVIDRITPRPFGTPQPADGILSYGEDISVKFNEPINSGELYNFGQYGSASYISLRGMTNGTDLTNSPSILHDASIHFDGQNDYAQINNINLNGSDFTIEFWARRASLGEQTILSLGNIQQGGLSLGFNSSNNFVINVDGQTVTSTQTYENTDMWAFYSIAYTHGSTSVQPQFTLFILDDAGGVPQTQEMSLYSSLEGSIFLGKGPEVSNPFNGNIHEFRIWNYARLSTEISSQKGQILNGYEQNLYGLWPMNEASGTVAKDIAFGRNAILNTTWEVSRDGKALDLTGTNSFPIPAGSMTFDNQADFTIEFWFKTSTPSSDATLLSNGNPDEVANSLSWNIYATNDNRIVVNNNGTDVSINAQSYLNNNWHHFAMTLNRLGYLSIYIDGDLIKTTSASPFDGFAGSKLVVGARWYNLSMIDYYDQYLTGTIDEIRVWNCARTASQIKRYMNHTLKGDEMGLKAYFPFEDVTIEDPSISNENSGNFTMDTIGVAGDTLLDAQYFTSESPNMKLQRPEILIPHTLTINNDEVIITPNIDASLIENQILDISIKRVKDMNNNEMSSTVSWNAFIDRNQVVWDVQNLNITKYVEQDTTIQVEIKNKGGVNENYEITNIPSWMEVTPTTGSLIPLGTQTININIKPELNIGSYQQDLNLVASMNYNERLGIHVNVNGHSPDWSVDESDFSKTANIIGQLSIADVISTDENDIVGCFVNGECRGVANVQYFETGNIYLVFMNVYANIDGETMEFKVYDASTGETYTNVTPEITFTENELYGSVSSPLPINATNYVEQNIALDKGWNWISFNVYAPEFNNLNTALQNLSIKDNAFIKSQTQFSSMLHTGLWSGSLDKLNVTSTYKMKVSATQNLVMEGYKVIPDTVEIPIVQGWNWIGYPLSIQKPLIDALSSLTPQDDDIIKSQHQFAVYSSALGWIGSLEYLQPGEGYVLYSSTNGTLTYSGGISAKSFTQVENDNDLPNTENNMTIIAEAILDNPETYTINAVDKNGICGKAEPITLANGSVEYFITINSKSPETIKFNAIHKDGSLQANEEVGFVANNKVGSLDKPMKLTFNGDFESLSNIYVYPNPFKDKVNISFTLNSKQNVQIRLFNAVGVEMSSTLSLNMNKGYQEVDILKQLKLNNLNSGVYILKVRINGNEEIVKIVKE